VPVRKRLASREKTAELASGTQLLHPPAGRHLYQRPCPITAFDPKQPFGMVEKKIFPQEVIAVRAALIVHIACVAL